jgi:hypothetical protein
MRRYPLVLVAAWMTVLPLVGRVLVGCNSSTGLTGSPNDTEDSGDASEAGNPTGEAGLQDSTVSGDSAAVDDATGDETDGNNPESGSDEGPPTDGAMLAETQVSDAEGGPADAQDGDAALADGDAGFADADAGLTDGDAGFADADAGLTDGDAGLADGPEHDTLLPEAGDGSLGTLSPTEQLLYNISPDCLSCAQTNDLFDVSSNGANCEQTFDTTDANICLATLTCVLHSGCDATGDPTSCLCGTIDAGTCYADTGGTPLNGACTTDYYAAYGTHDVNQFLGSLDDVSTSAGSADWLATLLVAYCAPACP